MAWANMRQIRDISQLPALLRLRRQRILRTMNGRMQMIAVTQPRRKLRIVS
ncbi:hypothetical protein D3C85_1767350 [compost metagenome]